MAGVHALDDFVFARPEQHVLAATRRDLCNDLTCKIPHRDLRWIAQIQRSGVCRCLHEADKPVNHVSHVAKATCLRSVAEDDHGQAAQGLADECRDGAAVAGA